VLSTALYLLPWKSPYTDIGNPSCPAHRLTDSSSTPIRRLGRPQTARTNKQSLPSKLLSLPIRSQHSTLKPSLSHQSLPYNSTQISESYKCCSAQLQNGQPEWGSGHWPGSHARCGRSVFRSEPQQIRPSSGSPRRAETIRVMWHPEETKTFGACGNLDTRCRKRSFSYQQRQILLVPKQ
jgi:hypothetical protein